MKEFLVGMAKGDITPPLGTLLFGYPSKRAAQRVLDNLNLSVIAMKQNDETVLLISFDITVAETNVCASIKESIYKELGVKPENIICSAIHTHSGPVSATVAGWGTANTDFLDNILYPTALSTARKALENMKPAVMAVGMTNSQVGINRREIANGEVILGQDPNGPYDPQMTVVSFKTTNGENIGSFIHFAAHPTACGPNLSITRDWPGLMMDKVEEITSAPCMFVNGTEGDVGPRLSNGKTTADEPSMLELGAIAAQDAEKAYENLGEFSVPTLKTLSGDMFFPSTAPLSYEETLAQIEALGNPEDLIEVNVRKYANLQVIKKMYETGEAFSEGIPFMQTLVALDDLVIVPIPFEAFCEIGLSLKQKSPFKITLPFGISNGSIGYLPTEEQIPYGGYEVDSFYAATIPSFIDGLDNHLVAENVKLLNKLKNK